MKARIADRGVLDGISPLELTSYLRGRGWAVAEQRDRYSLWTLSQPEAGEFEVLVPSSDRLRDYPLRISTALSVLETAEQRSQIVIARDLAQTTSDVIRFRLDADEADGGEVPIDYGLRLLQGARDAMLAAACSVVEPRPVYHTRKPAPATTYLSRLQLGQTEVGSYVVSLLSRVPPVLHAADAGQLFATPEDPFNRQVSLGFYTALGAAKQVAKSAQVSGDLNPLLQAVEVGVSANLCSALASVGQDLDLNGLDISFSWAPSRPVEGSPNPVVRFSPDDLTILEEASRWLKDRGNVEGYSLYGSVVKLESEDAEEGSIVVAGPVEGTPRKVHMDLEQPWYGRAIQAHAERRLVRAVGDVSKKGRRWTMTNIQVFTVPDLPDDDE